MNDASGPFPASMPTGKLGDVTSPRVAVVGDDLLRTRVERATATLSPAPAVLRVGSLAEAVALADGPASLHALVVGPPALHRARLEELADAAADLPLTALVLVAPTQLRAPAASVARTGAVDLLQAPGDEALRRSLSRAVDIGVSRHDAAGGRMAASTGVTARRVVTIASGTGGCGRTFYALNLASLLHRELGRKVCVVDFDLQFGEVSSALRIRPSSTIFDLVRAGHDDAAFAEHLQDVVVAHESGIHVLPAPNDPGEADAITPADAMRVIRALRAAYDDVIVDTPSTITEVVLASFDLSDELVVMVTPDVPSVRNLHVFLQTLEKLRIPSERVSVVLNKADRDLGIDLDEVQEVLGRQFQAVLPYSRDVSRSINRGIPVLELSPDAEVSRALRDGIVANLPPTMRRDATGPAPARRRWSSGLLRRSRLEAVAR